MSLSKLVKMVQQDTINKQANLLEQHRENMAQIKAYIQSDKFSGDNHGSNLVNVSDLLLRISEGEYELQRIQDDYCY